MYAYYYAKDIQQFNFYMLPKALFEEPFKKLSNDARTTYALLRDRMTLSQVNPDQFTDDKGHVFIYFKGTELQEILGRSKNSVTKYMDELRAAGLIQTERKPNSNWMNTPERIYVKNFAVIETDDDSEKKATKPKQNAVSQIMGDRSPNKWEAGVPENGSSDIAKSGKPEIPESGTSEDQKMGTRNSHFSGNNDIERNNTESNDTQSIHTSGSEGLTDEEKVSAVIKENISYNSYVKMNAFLDRRFDDDAIDITEYQQKYFDMKLIDRMVRYMTDTYCSNQEINVKGAVIPAARAKSRMMKINADVFEESYYKIKSQMKSGAVFNPKAYAVSVLFNG